VPYTRHNPDAIDEVLLARMPSGAQGAVGVNEPGRTLIVSDRCACC
jgi:hypothetical protein